MTALRWIDAAAAWLVVFAGLSVVSPAASDRVIAIVSAAAVGVGAFLPPFRLRWRPVSAWTGIVVSRSLRPGDRAWFVRHGQADPVLITARRGLRMAIAPPRAGEAETITVRRTRVLLVPFDAARA
jgi:hypothetical protein